MKCNFKPLLCFIGTNLSPSVLFTHFLEHLFAPIMGRSEEPNMGASHIRKSVPCELFLVRYIILQMTRRKKWDPESVKAAIEAMTNKEIGNYKPSRVFIVPQTTLQGYFVNEVIPLCINSIYLLY